MRREMMEREWFHAQIRLAVMEDSKRGLPSWEGSAYLFRSEDHETAFKQAIAEDRRREHFSKPGRHRIAVRLAKIVTLDRLGSEVTEFLAPWVSEKPTEHLAFDHIFEPDGALPPRCF